MEKSLGPKGGVIRWIKDNRLLIWHGSVLIFEFRDSIHLLIVVEETSAFHSSVVRNDVFVHPTACQSGTIVLEQASTASNDLECKAYRYVVVQCNKRFNGVEIKKNTEAECLQCK